MTMILPTRSTTNIRFVSPGSDLMAFLPMILIFGIFYFLLFMPMQRQKKQQREMLSSLQQGVSAAVAVVTDSRVLMQQGFGMRDVARSLPVTVNTLFAIGSKNTFNGEQFYTAAECDIVVEQVELGGFVVSVLRDQQRWRVPAAMPAPMAWHSRTTAQVLTAKVACQSAGLDSSALPGRSTPATWAATTWPAGTPPATCSSFRPPPRPLATSR